MAWKPRRAKHDWRRFLTEDERLIVAEADREAAAIKKQQAAWSKRWARDRQMIVNRAVQRSRQAARRST